MIIYKATNTLNNKAYIGLTNDLEFRKWTHFNDAEGDSDQVFHRAIRKYGENIFTWEVLAECNTREEAGELEVKLIEKHGTFNAGYNSTTGGEWGWTVSDEARAKMSKASKGKSKSAEHSRNIAKARTGTKLSEEIKNKISKSKLGKPNGRLGMKHSEETKRKIRESCKKNANPWNKGISPSAETRRKISESLKARVRA